MRRKLENGNNGVDLINLYSDMKKFPGGLFALQPHKEIDTNIHQILWNNGNKQWNHSLFTDSHQAERKAKFPVIVGEWQENTLG